MMAARAHLNELGYNVVGVSMSMVCGEDYDCDRKYSLLTLACSLAGGEKGWLTHNSRNVMPLSCNEAARSLYNYIRENTTDDINIVVRRDKTSSRLVQDSIDSEPNRQTPLYFIDVPHTNDRSSEKLHSLIASQNVEGISAYCMGETGSEPFSNIRRTLLRLGTQTEGNPAREAILSKDVTAMQVKLDDQRYNLTLTTRTQPWTS